MKKKIVVWISLAVVVAAGIYRWRNPPLPKPTTQQIQKALPNGAQAVSENADKLVLYSLDPHEMMKNQGHKTYFHEFGIVGETTVSDRDTMQQLRDAYYGSLDGGETAACFNPRHGLRAVKNGKTVDLLICFECGQSQNFFNGKENGGADVNHRGQQIFERIYFAKSGLKMAP